MEQKWPNTCLKFASDQDFQKVWGLTEMTARRDSEQEIISKKLILSTINCRFVLSATFVT